MTDRWLGSGLRAKSSQTCPFHQFIRPSYYILLPLIFQTMSTNGYKKGAQARDTTKQLQADSEKLEGKNNKNNNKSDQPHDQAVISTGARNVLPRLRLLQETSKKHADLGDLAKEPVKQRKEIVQAENGAAAAAPPDGPAEPGMRDEPTTVLEEIKGDLFTCHASASLCHCVSTDLAMGKGIAVLFKKTFGQVPQLKAQKAGIGQAAVLPKPRQENAFVYYLVTKARYFHKPTLQSVRASCTWMRHHAVRHGVTLIAMPLIGCGLDRLQWPDVKAIILETFAGTGIKLQVYRL